MGEEIIRMNKKTRKVSSKFHDSGSYYVMKPKFDLSSLSESRIFHVSQM